MYIQLPDYSAGLNMVQAQAYNLIKNFGVGLAFWVGFLPFTDCLNFGRKDTLPDLLGGESKRLVCQKCASLLPQVGNSA